MTCSLTAAQMVHEPHTYDSEDRVVLREWCPGFGVEYGVRRSPRSKAHRLHPFSLYAGKVTACGRWTRDMEIRVPLCEVEIEDRCRVCWLESAR